MIQCQIAKPDGVTGSVFFDLEQALHQHIDSSSAPTVKKSVVYNDEVSSQVISSYDLSSDLEMIESFNINNPNWFGKFSVDSILQTDGLIIKYNALTDETYLTQCEVVYDEAGLKNVSAQAVKNGLIADIEKNFKWSVNDQKLTLEVAQSFLVGEQRHFKQEIIILEK